MTLYVADAILLGVTNGLGATDFARATIGELRIVRITFALVERGSANLVADT